MIKFFGLLSKKKKIKLNSLVSIYCQTLDEVIERGFVEIKDFINNNNNLENNPNPVSYTHLTLPTNREV